MTGALTAKWRTFTGLEAGLRSLIMLSFVVALGSYMVTPFIGVLMVEAVGLDVRVAGILVAVATFIQFGGSILGGPVVDRLGLKGSKKKKSKKLDEDWMVMVEMNLFLYRY